MEDELLREVTQRRMVLGIVGGEAGEAGANGAGGAVSTRAPGFDEADPATWGNPSRNDPCPCGSGKKYKHCHGQLS